MEIVYVHHNRSDASVAVLRPEQVEVLSQSVLRVWAVSRYVMYMYIHDVYIYMLSGFTLSRGDVQLWLLWQHPSFPSQLDD